MFNDMAISLNKSYLSTFEKSNSRIDYIFVNKNTELKGYTVEKNLPVRPLSCNRLYLNFNIKKLIIIR